MELPFIVEADQVALLKHGFLSHWEGNEFIIRDLDKVLGVYFFESKRLRVMHSLPLSNIQYLLNIAISLIFHPDADIYFLSLIFKDEGLVRCLQSDDCSLSGIVVELSTKLLKANLLLFAQVADYCEHAAT